MCNSPCVRSLKCLIASSQKFSNSWVSDFEKQGGATDLSKLSMEHFLAAYTVLQASDTLTQSNESLEPLIAHSMISEVSFPIFEIFPWK